jgi:hypothetical protein
MKMSDQELIAAMAAAVTRERECSVATLRQLASIEAQEHYKRLGHASMMDFLVNDLDYHRGDAEEHLEGSRLMARFPSIAGHILAGRIDVTTLFLLGPALTLEGAKGAMRVNELVLQAAELEEDQVCELVLRVQNGSG